jgi:hypothetical protein
MSYWTLPEGRVAGELTWVLSPDDVIGEAAWAMELRQVRTMSETAKLRRQREGVFVTRHLFNANLFSGRTDKSPRF